MNTLSSRPDAVRAFLTAGVAAVLCTGTAAPAHAASIAPAPAPAAEVCAPGSGTQIFKSSNGYTRALAKLCAKPVALPGGGKAVEATLEARFQYYWGLAWHPEKAGACSVTGTFEKRRYSGGAPTFDDLGGSCGEDGVFRDTVRFPASADRYVIYAGAHKNGGYWAKNTKDSAAQDHNTNYIHIKGLAVAVTVP
ncbi:hypothetical protein [Actinomadura hibisca]|uniref:hypothetical protein n=1 Tax=Actinomadura hibisca TaxID=68565 RepID=UPI0008313ECF|nr:hypothetical protein [Actinomadura hibisca]